MNAWWPVGSCDVVAVAGLLNLQIAQGLYLLTHREAQLLPVLPHSLLLMLPLQLLLAPPLILSQTTSHTFVLQANAAATPSVLAVLSTCSCASIA